ncbi:unnamed protein product (macronuclear) [Paramecium tetraurelia]|uniref:Tyrosine-protein phosphatase domain-containing protein n=1 Tax=Paramecium tetraurelia TaxID=5888 RepID=A0BTZ8_PARTE|nr:uncharacterized protein GSPATT00032247001 [Paramecium tetraurelia]CAK62015.1 unnamed protein product [Paramecium tetraurelia]|eukprot:XP_001429413.1 hypothetical protein (macronuclear) [Paramecium tetraurelia strain d4-2]
MKSPTRIINGLYIGDQGAAHDLEFLITNKIKKIINCAGKQIPNHWESIGIEYLTYGWIENDYQYAIDHSRCFSFINDTLEAGEAVLVHSISALNRSVFVIVVFLMKKFKWTLQKTLQYIQNLKHNPDIKQNVMQQLVNFEKWLLLSNLANNQDFNQYYDEVLARNTYLNSQKPQQCEPRRRKEVISKRVQWNRTIISQYIPPYYQIQFKNLSKLQSDPVNQVQIKNPQLPATPRRQTTDNWMNKKLPLNQIVDDKKLNLFNIKSERQSIRPQLRPGTAPQKRLVKNTWQSQSHRVLVKQS